ncbi:hypothetical protein [uncultured Ruminococcus sp.]|uniref:hypothetical protein n=1 Tax=uncultured Ruminococcus sp. TaxID=165186 RepID=UPI0025F80A22|nr:hypothetical protein [uncultured Ruminococcus sp.]
MTRKLTFSLADTKHGKVPPYLDKYRQKWYDQIYKIENLWGFITKKLIAAILSLTLVFPVSACGNADNDSTTSEKDNFVELITKKSQTKTGRSNRYEPKYKDTRKRTIYK